MNKALDCQLDRWHSFPRIGENTEQSSYLWAGNFKSVSKVIHKMHLRMSVCMRKEIKHENSNERDKLMTTVTMTMEIV